MVDSWFYNQSVKTNGGIIDTLKKYFVVYGYTMRGDLCTGYGNVPVMDDRNIFTEDVIRETVENIKKKFDYDSVVILNIIPLEG